MFSTQCFDELPGASPSSTLFAPDRLLTATFHGSDWLTGGKLGPEASLLVFPVIAVMFVAFHLVYPAATKPEPATANT